jgi:hypothetical protein
LLTLSEQTGGLHGMTGKDSLLLQKNFIAAALLVLRARLA